MPTRSSLFDSTIRPEVAPFTPGEQQLLATFVANSLHRLGSAAIERILVFGSRARGEGGEDSDLDLAVFVSRDAHRSIARGLTDIAESAQEGSEDLPHLRPIVIRDGDGTSRRLLDDIMREGIELWAKTSA